MPFINRAIHLIIWIEITLELSKVVCLAFYNCFQVDPKGGSVVVGFNDGVVRILGVSKLLDESSRKKKHHECSLQLLQAFKPHSQAVTSIAVDIKGEVMASGVRFRSSLQTLLIAVNVLIQIMNEWLCHLP